jgi:hypothetical protein
MPNQAVEDTRAVQVARAFFQAATKLSEDNEDILPQVEAFETVCAFPAFNVDQKLLSAPNTLFLVIIVNRRMERIANSPCFTSSPKCSPSTRRTRSA